MSKKASSIFLIIIFALIIILANSSKDVFYQSNNETTQSTKSSKTFTIISSQENKPLEDEIKAYAKSQKYDIDIQYEGTLDIIKDLNKSPESYDAVWISNSIWNYMLDDNVKLSNSKCTSINPVVFGIKKSKAQELGFIGKTVYTKDIVSAIQNGKLKFSMSNPTSTNSGASAYLGMLATLAGNPEVLTEQNLEDETLKTNLKTLFTGLERSSGNEDFLEEMFLNGDYEAVVTYESSIINMDKKLVQQGKEPLYAIYPVDGVSISDSPFAYVDNKDSNKKKIFQDLQNYILGNEGQELLQKNGKRTWYGGVTDKADKSIFNPDWGIDTTKYISPVKYPSTAVIKQALYLYQEELRKPTHIAFCLDYSGSMSGEGINDLRNAMEYILSEQAKDELIQFTSKDKIDIYPFSNKVHTGDEWKTSDGSKTDVLLKSINNLQPYGSTAIYPAAIEALKNLSTENTEQYNTSIVLMTDGKNNVGTFNDLKEEYSKINKDIPIYTIMFGNADSRELEKIANLTNAKVFDGKTDLKEAFKEVRGYN